jgi:DNA-binding transcriptional LysR family regulator
VKLQQLKQFVAVAEALNFHRAAEKLHIAQAPLSMAIRRLEDELGVRLFDRTSHSVSLTEAGRAALEPARNAIYQADQVRRIVAEVSSGDSGTLTLQFVPSAMMSFLPRAIAAFREAHPRVTLTLNEGDTRSIVNRLERCEIDVGVIRFPAPASDVLTMTPIHEDAYVAALPVGHKFARARRLKLVDLAHETFVMPSAEGNPTLHDSIMATCYQSGFSPSKVNVSDQAHTMLALVESGLGVALIPQAWERMASPGVVLKQLIDQVRGRTGLSVAYRHDMPSRLKTRIVEIAMKAEQAILARENRAEDI